MGIHTSITRRDFIATGAASAALAGMAGVAVADEPQAAVAATPAFLEKPPVPEQVVEERDCDVLVIGMGLAGTAALKAAAEEGAVAIALEKQPEDEYTVVFMAGDFGVVGSQIQKDLGIEWAPKADIVNEMAKECGSRIDTWMMGYWYDHSGADFDWFVDGADYEVLTATAAEKTTDNPCYIRPKCFPKSESYDYHEEYYPYFHGTITTNPNMAWACAACLEAAKAAGAEVMYGCAGEQLIVDDSGAVVGAYALRSDGYVKINAKSVVLACGDYSGNPEMVDYWCPQVSGYASYSFDTGDGHLMGIWAGGRMENGPHAPMTHHMGAALGVDSYLQLNMLGKRFMNEDIPGQDLTNMLNRQPKATDPELAEQDVRAFQIFDSAWPEQISSMPDGHGYTSHFVPDDEVDQYPLVLSGFGLGWTSRQMVEDAVTFKADTIEELAELMKLPVDTVVAEVERYNELARAGYDEDFGKMAKRMFPLENPPYYACAFNSSQVMLVIVGGLECNHDLAVVNDDNEPIGGLFVAGNNMGRRILVDYPVIVAGISLATALTFGRLAGTNAAKAALL